MDVSEGEELLPVVDMEENDDVLGDRRIQVVEDEDGDCGGDAVVIAVS